MENNKNNPMDPIDLDSVDNEAWLKAILGETQEESDENAVTPSEPDISDQELDEILHENWDTPETPEAPSFDPEYAQEQQYTDSMENIPYDDVGDVNGTESQDPPKKGRPKRKKGYGLWGIPHILSTVIWLGLIVVIGVSLGRTIWVCTADLMAFGKPDHEVVVTISDGDTLDAVAKKLADADLVRYPGLFKTFASITGKEDRISTGTFTLNSKLDYNAMINAMGYYAAAREEVEVVIPERYNCAQLFNLLEEKDVCSAAELGDYAANGELDDYWFLENIDRSTPYCLEGYLAPDTYKFYTNDEPERVLEKMLDEFGKRMTDKMKEKLELLQQRYASALASHGKDSSYIEAHPITLHSVVTLASIIERETSSGDESYDMASVFFNRLTNPGSYPHLESKATVHYAVGDYFGKIKTLKEEDYTHDSPYNTFVCEGLPAGPVCNPSVNSIYAAIDPNKTDYYYYVFDTKENKHHFASTESEHQKNIQLVEAHKNEED